MSEYMKCPCFNEWIRCDPAYCEWCGISTKEVKKRASKMLSNPKDALKAFKELKRRKGID